MDLCRKLQVFCTKLPVTMIAVCGLPTSWPNKQTAPKFTIFWKRRGPRQKNHPTYFAQITETIKNEPYINHISNQKSQSPKGLHEIKHPRRESCVLNFSQSRWVQWLWGSWVNYQLSWCVSCRKSTPSLTILSLTLFPLVGSHLPPILRHPFQWSRGNHCLCICPQTHGRTWLWEQAWW